MAEEDGDEIKKTTEQWRWSEQQGLELLVSCSSPPPPPPPPPHFANNSDAASSSSANLRQNSLQRRDASSPPMAASNDGGGGAGSPPPSVAFRDLFRFADRLDYALMTIGTAGAIVHGSSLPLFLRFFADLVNSFGSNAGNVDKMSKEVLKVRNSAVTFLERESVEARLHFFLCFLLLCVDGLFAVCILLSCSRSCHLSFFMGR